MTSYIYFIYDPDTQLVKIGKANDVQKRFATFLTANPNLRLLGYKKCKSTKASFALESQLHKRFAVYQVYENREWFKLSPPVLLYLYSQGVRVPINYFTNLVHGLRVLWRLFND